MNGVYLHLKDLLNNKCELYLKQPLTPSNCIIIAAYRTSIEIAWWLTTPIPGEKHIMLLLLIQCGLKLNHQIDISPISYMQVPSITLGN